MIQEEAFKSQFFSAREDMSTLPERLKHDLTGVMEVFNETIGFAPDEAETDSSEQSISTIDSVFLTLDHASDPHWSHFKKAQSIQPADAQKTVILANDANLSGLYKETVPSMITDSQFWEGWLFFQFLKKHRPAGHQASVRPQSPLNLDTWDNDDFENLKVDLKAHPRATHKGNEWEEWD
jgi:hypothetical protein